MRTKGEGTEDKRSKPEGTVEERTEFGGRLEAKGTDFQSTKDFRSVPVEVMRTKGEGTESRDTSDERSKYNDEI
ncbi:hypothetical protein SNEBB_003147 [Seison nebaliae]|nr:hypothetical protein SNEBB_003147 [Seison nebaliae]